MPSPGMLKLRPRSAVSNRDSHRGLLSSGVEIECDLREIEHPEGRFLRADGTRYDVCIMELMADPSLRPPSISRDSFVGDRADTQSSVLRVGNVRQSSFRLRLVSPGSAFGTTAVSGKPPATLST